MKICRYCGSNKTAKDKIGYEKWHKLENGYTCQKCYNKLIGNSITNPKRLVFMKKRIFLKEPVRTGYCSKCSNNIYDGSCKRTHLHHMEYNENNPISNTIELCASCHRIETIRIAEEVSK